MGERASAPSTRVTARVELARLRARAAARFALADIRIAVPGAPDPYTISLPANPDDPLDELARQQHHPDDPAAPPVAAPNGAARQARQSVATGAHMPYWALLWPSGIALAAALLSAPRVASPRRVLELGCGLGVTATAALACSADLWAVDCFTDALLYCRYNTLRNTGRQPHTRLLDWRTGEGQAACIALAPFDLVLAADILYEPEDIAPLLALLPQLLGRGGECWLAEPGRRSSRAFVAEAPAHGWRDTPATTDRAWPPDGAQACVTVHRLTLPDT